MKRAVLVDTKTLIIDEVSPPVCGEGDILVKVAYAGICRTDRKAYHLGQRDLHMPRVLGHEIAGTVWQVGSEVRGYGLGDKVHVHPGIFCGSCVPCCQGQDQLCREMEILGFHRDGGFQEICHIPASAVARGVLTPLPDAADLSLMALSEPLACAIHMMKRLKPRATDRLLIVGGGVLGVMMAKLCQYQQRGMVQVVEIDPHRCDFLKQKGLDAFTPTEEHRLIAADIAIPCCPDNGGFSMAVAALKPRGKLGFFSGLTAAEPPSRDLLNLLHYRELSLYGAYGCSLEDTREAVRMILEGFPLADLPKRFVNLLELESVLQELDLREGLINLLDLS